MMITATDKEFRLSKVRKSRRTKEVDQLQTGDAADIDTDHDIDHGTHYEGDDDGHERRTPTSKEHEIPVPRTCPPAPKKVRRRTASTAIALCKSMNGITSPNNDVIDSNGCSNGSIELLDGHECRLPPSPPQTGSPVTPTSVVSSPRIISSCHVVTDKEVGNITGGAEGTQLIDDHVKEEEDCRDHSNGDDEDGYITPTSEEHKIPVPRSCPGAPRVKRTRSRSPITPVSAVVFFKRSIYQREK